jgi:hypothetical protein
MAIPVAIVYYTNPTGTWHLFHLATMPDDLFTPIIIDKFEFHTKEHTKEYKLDPKYRDLYEVLIFNENGFISEDFRSANKRPELKGEYKIQLFNGKEIVFEDTIKTWTRATFKNNDMKTYSDLTIYEFPIPLKGFSTSDIKLRISVIKPSSILEKYKQDIELRVRVSASK